MVGSHLAEYLLGLGQEVHGTIRWRSNLENILEMKDRLNLHYCDLKDRQNIDTVLKDDGYNFIFHLAAQSIVWASFQAPADTLENNVIGTLNLLESAKRFCPKAIIHFSGSSEEFGLVKENECPVNESNPLRPLSPYGVSKVTAELLCIQYFKSYGLKTVVTRAFNHSGFGRPEHFAESSFAKQIMERKLGMTIVPIEVGNLEARRDYTHVNDMVEAYWLAANMCAYGEPYVIASSEAYSMRQILEMLSEEADIVCDVVQDPKRIRPSDVPLLIGDASKFRNRTGWTQTHGGIRQICRDLLEYWKVKLERQKIEEVAV